MDTPFFYGQESDDAVAYHKSAAALGGSGLLVGPARETAAHYSLPSVAAVADWLAAAA